MPTECPAPDGSSPKRQRFDGPPPMCIDPQRRFTAQMVTSKGTMTIALDALAAPKTVNNFVVLARYHYFDGIAFHRVIPGFILQGGDPEGTGRGGPGYRFEDEPVTRNYSRGTLAMANSGPNTNGSQFFIVHADASLQPNYTIFGKVTEGEEVLDAIANVPVELNPSMNEDSAPTDEVTIQRITIEES